MDLCDVMRTTFSAREFTDDPVPDEVLFTILDNARFASSGGNRQGWRVIVVRDATTKAAIAGLQIPAIKRYIAQVQAGENPFNIRDAIREYLEARTQNISSCPMRTACSRSLGTTPSTPTRWQVVSAMPV